MVWRGKTIIGDLSQGSGHGFNGNCGLYETNVAYSHFAGDRVG